MYLSTPSVTEVLYSPGTFFPLGQPPRSVLLPCDLWSPSVSYYTHFTVVGVPSRYVDPPHPHTLSQDESIVVVVGILDPNLDYSQTKEGIYYSARVPTGDS